jgi:putative ABC transport system ATP-binding protein
MDAVPDAGMIVVSELRKSLRTGGTTVDILRGIDFSVARGEFVAIMGASGSGKSTLLGLLAGLDNPTSGSVALNGTVISNLPEDKLAQLRGKTIGFVFQSYQLIPTLTALENVGNSSGWRWRGRLFCGLRSCWRMSLRGIWIR